MTAFKYLGGALPLNRPYIFGIVNVTPDSFSDGGSFFSDGDALRRCRELLSGGADVLDIGAESTRPGSVAIEADEEIARLGPVLPAAAGMGAPLSVDTYHLKTARWALERGAAILNTVVDITRNSDLIKIAAEFGAGLVITHSRELFGEVKKDLLNYFDWALGCCENFGLDLDRVILDVGIGFQKDTAQSAAAFGVIADVKREFGRAVMLAHSRKRMVGDLFEINDPKARDVATAALSALGYAAGADFVRVHDAAKTKAALLKVAERREQ